MNKESGVAAFSQVNPTTSLKTMSERKSLPVSSGEFKIIRQNSYLYVDKTEYLYSLIKTSGAKYFFRRPRRFGKSLTVSTLEALLQGKKELFEGLWIYDRWAWAPYSVIRFDLSQVSQFKNNEELTNDINELIIYCGQLNSVKLDKMSKWSTNLKTLVRELKLRGPVAILIDEYDNPFHKALDWSEELQEVTRHVFRDFYNILKSLESQYDFMFMTGITKIAKTSVFSGINNIEDISLEPQYSSLCGITQEELETNFKAHIDYMSKTRKESKSEILKLLQQRYNGYRFSPENTLRVYNPFSLHLSFHSNKISDYWFESGTPTLLVNLIKKNDYDLSLLDSPEITANEVKSSYDFSLISLNNLLLQTGYLTINEVLSHSKKEVNFLDPDDIYFSLAFPNSEVKSAFLTAILKSIREKEITPQEKGLGKELLNALSQGNWTNFASIWNVLLSYIPSSLHVAQEKYYHSLFLLFLAINGLEMQAEKRTSIGQMDVAIEFSDKIYILELKLDQTATKALKQIHDKNYFSVYLNKKKPIVLVGMSFSYKSKKISEIVIEELDKKTQEIVFKDNES